MFLSNSNSRNTQYSRQEKPSVLNVKGRHSIHMLNLDSTVTFIWTATTDGHNVNFIGKQGQSQPGGKTAEKFYKECITNETLPTGMPIDNKPGVPNYVHHFTETGIYYFFCGIVYPGGGHCIDGGVKAMVNVVTDPSDCHFHSHPKCGEPGTPPPSTTPNYNSN